MRNAFGVLLFLVVAVGLAAGAAFGVGTAYGRATAPVASPTTATATTGQGESSATGAGQSSSSGSGGAGAMGGFAGLGSGTTGTVERVDGDILTLTTSSGSVKVSIGKDTAVRKSAEGTRDDLQTGASVLVQGQRSPDNSIAAQSIQVVPEGVASMSAGRGGGGQQRSTPGGGGP
ncbi:MAG: hypothetical protein HYX89_01135 [Chloroflexi bacterium]|nr:hypothetical protein [Chloroflexota bacterium]